MQSTDPANLAAGCPAAAPTDFSNNAVFFSTNTSMTATSGATALSCDRRARTMKSMKFWTLPDGSERSANPTSPGVRAPPRSSSPPDCRPLARRIHRSFVIRAIPPTMRRSRAHPLARAGAAAGTLSAATGGTKIPVAPAGLAPELAAASSHAAFEPDNDFLFGTEDPQGLRCPLGAHIRRANPRESF